MIKISKHSHLSLSVPITSYNVSSTVFFLCDQTYHHHLLWFFFFSMFDTWIAVNNEHSVKSLTKYLDEYEIFQCKYFSSYPEISMESFLLFMFHMKRHSFYYKYISLKKICVYIFTNFIPNSNLYFNQILHLKKVFFSPQDTQ